MHKGIDLQLVFSKEFRETFLKMLRRAEIKGPELMALRMSTTIEGFS